MLFPFLRDMFRPRNVSSAPQGFYKQTTFLPQDNALLSYEATIGPPWLDIAARGDKVGQGPGPVGALFLPMVEIPSNPTLSDARGLGGQVPATFIGGGPLIRTAQSSPETQLF